MTDWRFNAWGGKYPPFDRDNRIPRSVARALGLRRFENKMVLEGGSIDVNGAGAPPDDRGLPAEQEPQSRAHPRRRSSGNLRAYLGIHTVLWLGDGILGDDTDGHVDDLARFFSADGIVTAVERNRRDANHRPLQREPRAAALAAHAVGRPVHGGRAADARALVFRGTTAARELREFPRHQRRRADAGVPPAAARQRGGRGPRRPAFPGAR